VPSGSFQKYSGIDGIGRVTTNSPTWSTTGKPSASYAAKATPRWGADNSPAQTGVLGALPAKPDTTSVPPLIDASSTRSPTWSRTQG
jgi:hypothetical protein